MDERCASARVVDVIDLTDAYQVSQWTEIFDITEAELIAATSAVGCRAADVKRYLRARKMH
jgi:Protein of unknown function (DUF3606)